ncbi:hypothetical protein CFC21_099691 [Triticum aestivum]|uniref:DUF4408 domain-containing protein n=3 Tax=Triticum TaxID=4564 RepID=A0A9R0ZKZ1_TRITD|nr:uncharacterized protein LOC119334716 [Triticum dicoccoides]XP_044429047.1 uncharacterized protein LOC123154357 [Triticum aestivum]KAF7097909.1 hypothetical protein CFC21_099691 [Triticum aestivum]VAI79803.1 unnamed protein product [Triticum turgidum subsp. durum]
MEKTNVRLPQLAKIAALLLLFILVPMVPPSLRAPYLYLLFNALVVALGVEAGFLSVSTGTKLTGQPPAAAAAAVIPNHHHHLVTSQPPIMAAPLPGRLREVNLLADRGAINEVLSVAKKLKEEIKKVPSRASIFFIGSADPHDAGEIVDATSTLQDNQAGEGRKRCKVDASSHDLMSKQELYAKADAFIGNFYKQLKMQREESWNKLQDLCSYHHHHNYKAKAF